MGRARWHEDPDDIMTGDSLQKILVVSMCITLAIVASSAYVFWQYSIASPEAQDELRGLVENTLSTSSPAEFFMGFVSGTEYFPKQIGQVIVEARYGNGTSALIGEGNTTYVLESSVARTLFDDAETNSIDPSGDVLERNVTTGLEDMNGVFGLGDDFHAQEVSFSNATSVDAILVKYSSRASGTVEVTVQTDSGSEPSGTLAQPECRDTNSLGTTIADYIGTFNFTASCDLVAGTSYWVVINLTGTASTTMDANDDDDAIQGTQLRKNAGDPSWSTINFDYTIELIDVYIDGIVLQQESIDTFTIGINETNQSGLVTTSNEFDRVQFSVTATGVLQNQNSVFFYDFEPENSNSSYTTDVTGNGNDGRLWDTATTTNDGRLDLTDDGDMVVNSVSLFDGTNQDIFVAYTFEYRGDSSSRYHMLPCSSLNFCTWRISPGNPGDMQIQWDNSQAEEFDTNFSSGPNPANYTLFYQYNATTNSTRLWVDSYDNEIPKTVDTLTDNPLNDAGKMALGVAWSNGSGNEGIADSNTYFDNFLYGRGVATEEDRQLYFEGKYLSGTLSDVDATILFTCDNSQYETGGEGAIDCFTSGSQFQYNFTLNSGSATEVKVDYKLQTTTFDQLWDPVATRLDGGRWAGSATTFGRYASEYGAGGCIWAQTLYGYDTGYSCGPATNTKAVQRIVNETDGVVIVGTRVNASLTHRKSDGGSLGATYAEIVVADNDATKWVYQQQRSNCGGFCTPQTEDFGPFDSSGLSFDLIQFRLYQIIDGVHTEIGRNDTELAADPFCDLINPVSSNVYECDNARNAVLPPEEFAVYTYNGMAYVERNGQVIISAETNYSPSEITTYGFVGHERGNPYNLELLLWDIEDITADEFIQGEASTCDAWVWYPDKSSFIDEDRMILSPSSENAYIQFEVPKVEGVYEYQSRCNINNITKVASKSFHVTKKRISATVIK